MFLTIRDQRSISKRISDRLKYMDDIIKSADFVYPGGYYLYEKTYTKTPDNATIKDGAVQLSVDVPGVPLEDISVTYSKNILKIETLTENRKYTYEYSTPELDPDEIEAKLNLGVLSIRAKLKEKEPEAVKIKVKSE